MDQGKLVLILGLSALATLASLVGLFSLIRRRKARAARAAKSEQGPQPFARVEALLTPSERALYSALRPAAVAQGADVFARVPLGDVVLVRKGAPDYEARSQSVAACRVGFLLCDRERLVPLLALEIDGDRARGCLHDAEFLGQALAAVGVPLAHVEARSSYDPDVIAALVRDQITQAPANAAEAPDAQPPRRPRSGWQAPAFSASWLGATPALTGEVQPPAGSSGGEQAADSPAAPPPTAGTPGNGHEPGEGAGGAAAQVPVDQPAADSAQAERSVTAPGDAQLGGALAAGPTGGVPTGDAGKAAPQPADAAPGPLCPACGSALVEMQDLETGVVVLACSRYPECPHVQAH